jgi:hypothetical protein
MIMTPIPAVELNHARTRAKFLDQMTPVAARSHVWNNSGTQNTVAARHNIFDRSKIALQVRVPLEARV